MTKTAADVNRLSINIQRALAKIAVEPISTLVLSDAGEGTGKGVFAPDGKWALGNINKSVYPIQQYDGNIVKSTRYNDTAAIKPTTGTNQNWAYKLDNGRWIPATKTYVSQNLTVSEVKTQINSGYANNVAFGTGDANRVYVTENNNKTTLNAYSTFILFAGKYTPNTYVDSVSNMKVITYGQGDPIYSNSPVANKDTLYYVQTFGTTGGMFFHGKRALRQYVGWVILDIGNAYDPNDNSGINATSYAQVTDYINDLLKTDDGKQAKLQAYYQGNCFYRIWIRDSKPADAANKILVRRNHIYQVSINDIRSPGIGDPNDIIDPDPEHPDPIEETETYVTATISLLDWHVVNQTASGGLD
jgi:hypothetical protein